MQSLSYTRLQIFYLLLINLPHLRSILNYFAARNPIRPGNLGSKICSHSSQCSDDRKYGNVKWRVVLKQNFAPDHCVIARLSRGARAGPGWTRRSGANPHSAFWTLWAPIFTVSLAATQNHKSSLKRCTGQAPQLSRWVTSVLKSSTKGLLPLAQRKTRSLTSDNTRGTFLFGAISKHKYFNQ